MYWLHTVVRRLSVWGTPSYAGNTLSSQGPASLLYVARTDEHCECCAILETFQRQPWIALLCLFVYFWFVFLSRNICMFSNMAFSPVLIFSLRRLTLLLNFVYKFIMGRILFKRCHQYPCFLLSILHLHFPPVNFEHGWHSMKVKCH